MASRGSVLRAQPRKALADESVLLVRWCGLLLRIILVTVAYKYVLKECLPGEFALPLVSTLYGISVIHLFPGASTSRGLAASLAIASRLMPHTSQADLGRTSGLDDCSERPTASRSGERSGQIAHHTIDPQVSSQKSTTTRNREKGTTKSSRTQLRVNGR